MSSGISLNNKTRYLTNLETEKYDTFLVPELKQYKYKFTDPLTVNFKILIDFDKTSGLFAKEDNVNSALAYLKRIGELNRYEMLKTWINVFRNFIKHLDFLITGCEGVDSIVNFPAGHMFTDNEKVTITVRETSDMLIQSLLTTYRHIWFDDERWVEVLPSNLRKFNLGILIYSAGYYNMALYDVYQRNELSESERVESNIYPTLRKLSEEFFINNTENLGFNHHLVYLTSASINNEDSGKNFFGTLSNKPSDDIIENQIVLNFKFASYKGVFNNIFGGFDFVKLLALSAAQDKVATSILTNTEYTNDKSYLSTYNAIRNNFKDYSKQLLTGLETSIDYAKSRLKSKSNEYLNTLLGKNSVIGNAFVKLSDPKVIPNSLNSFIDMGISDLDKQVYKGVAQLNNLVINNFSDNFLDAYDLKELETQNLIENKQADTIPTNLTTPTDDTIPDHLSTKIRTLEYRRKINNSDGSKTIF